MGNLLRTGVCVFLGAWHLAPSAMASGGDCGTEVLANPPPGAVWTAAGSPYCVRVDILISALTIEPGVTVRVAEDRGITVQTVLFASGTAEEPITFTALDDGTRWTGLEFTDTPPGSVLRHCIVERSSNSGIRIFDGSPVTIEDSIIRENTTTHDGGGVRCENTLDQQIFLRTSILNNSSAGDGGGLFFSGSGAVILDRCDLRGNLTRVPLSNGSTRGGGACFTGGAVSLVRNCAVQLNIARAQAGNAEDRSASGGGLAFGAGTHRLEACLISENACVSSGAGGFSTRRAHGGGVSVSGDDAELDIRNCVIAGNDLTGSVEIGGGVHVSEAALTVVHSTIARNDRSGVHASDATGEVRNSILYFNDGGGPQTSVSSGAVALTYSCVQNGPNSDGNIALNPAFAGAGDGLCDLTITPGSPCVDAGDPAGPDDAGSCESPPFDGNTGDGRNLPDMGAHGGPLACDWDIAVCDSLANVNGDCVIDFFDVQGFLNLYSAGDPRADILADGLIDFFDVQRFLSLFAAGCP